MPVDELVELLAFTEGMPPLGSAIVEEAEDRGLEDPILLALQLLVQPMDIKIPGPIGKDVVRFVPGHTVGGAHGPDLDVKVMVIGKMPWSEEQTSGRIFSGPSGELWKEMVTRHGADISNWYLTNAVRFMPPRRAKQLKAGWLKECRWFLEQEIAIMKPSHILVFGTDAAKMLFGRGATVTKMRGVEDLAYGGAKVLVTTHPSAVVADPTQLEGLELDLLRFVGMVTGERKTSKHPCDYEAIYTEERLAQVVDKLIAEDKKKFTIDCEWGGHDGSDVLRGELRYLQFSPAPYVSYAVVLNKEGLIPAFQPSFEAAFKQLSRLFNRPGVRICGHNFRADIKWADKHGLNVHEEFAAGFDTMLGYHMLHPNQGWGYGLEQLAVRYTDCGRYEKPVEQWLDAHGYKKKDIRKYGYAFVPDELLLPYAMTDTDVTFRSWEVIEKKLEQMKIGPAYGPYDYHGTRVESMLDLYFLAEHPVSEPILEVEQTGFLADVERLKHLVKFFADKYEGMLSTLRERVNWAEFNPRSIKQVREFLFGFCDGASLDENGVPTGATKHMPEGATCLFLTPVKTTGKPSKDWNRLSAYEKRFANPSTDSESLSILADSAPLARELAQLRFVDQIIKNFLRAADEASSGNEDEVEVEVFSDGDAAGDEGHGDVFSTGLLGCVDMDGRVRTGISQLTDTGRWRSSAPNMMNLPKKQETELKQIFSPTPTELLATVGWTGLSEVDLKSRGLLDPGYFTIRSCFMASPGTVLVEADYCVAAGTRIATQRGRVSIEDIKPGQDSAIQEDGSMKPITALLRRGVKDTVCVELSGGMRLRCTDEHRVRVINVNGDYVWRRVGDLLTTDWVALATKHVGDTRVSLPWIREVRHYNENGAVRAPRVVDEGIAELFGYLVGDGSVSEKYVSAVVAVKDQDTVARIAELWQVYFGVTPRREEYRGVVEFTTGSRRLAEWLTLSGYSKAHVPAWLWQCGRKEIAAFLRGYFEADGCGVTRPSASSSRQTLILEVQQLLMALGIVADSRETVTNLRGRAFKGYGVVISSAYTPAFSESVGFIGKRKKVALAKCGIAHNGIRRVLPNQQNKVRLARGKMPEAAVLLANVRNIGRTLTYSVAVKLRELGAEKNLSAELFRLLDYNQDFRRVRRVSAAGPCAVFDLTVPGTHTYVGDGFVNHNCQAELNVLGKISKDKNLIGVLSDKARDIHSELALDAFGLPRCTPKEVKKLYPSKRDAAKKSVYGIVYQLGYAALVRQVRREGVPDFTLEQARVLGDTFFELYPLTYDYIQQCKAAVGNPGYVESPFGRRRYFYPTSDDSVRASQERQAVNMPIQGTVAEALAIGMINLVNYRKYVAPDVNFRLLLPVHDAILLEVPVGCLDRVVEEALPLCMCRQAQVPHIGLELSIDTTVYRRWGEKMTKAEAVAEAKATS